MAGYLVGGEDMAYNVERGGVILATRGVEKLEKVIVVEG